MGIHDLLKIFKPVLRQIHISELKNKTVAIDIMTWLYRGVYSCCNELNNNIQTDLYLNYPLKMISMLSQFNIKIVAVFDGKDLKAKAQEDSLRLKNKEKNLELAQIIEQTGEADIARKICKRALTVSDKMINSLLAILRKLGIQYYIAPYEADAQITYLCKMKICDFAISEDSDLIPYGCPNILFKLNPNGEGLYFEWDKFKSSSDASISSSKELLLLKKMSCLNFIEYCVMLGCDYLDSIKGYGLKGATKLYKTYVSMDLVYKSMCGIDKFKPYLELFEKENFESYLNKAQKVVSLFCLQTVYSPIKNKLVQLCNIDSNIELKEYINKNKIQFVSNEVKFEYYGKHFDDYIDFCTRPIISKQSELDEIESNDIIHKYYLKYRDTCSNMNLLFSVPISYKDNLTDEFNIDSKVYSQYYKSNEIEMKKKQNLILDDEEIEFLFKNTKKENIEETKEKIINKKVEELVKIQIVNQKPIKSLCDLLSISGNKNNDDEINLLESNELNNKEGTYLVKNGNNRVFDKFIKRQQILLGKKTVFKFD